MPEDPKPEKVPVLVYQLSLTWCPDTGEFDLQGPVNNRPLCYTMLALAYERLLILAVQQERKRVITPGAN